MTQTEARSPGSEKARRRRGKKLWAKRVDAAIQRDLLTDRLGITALPKGPSRTRQRVVAWALIVFVYLLGWRTSTQAAFTMLLNDGHYLRGPYTAGVFLTNLVPDALVVVAAVLGIIWFLPRTSARPAAWKTSLRTVPIYHALPLVVMLSAAGVSTIVSLETYDYPPREYPTDALVMMRAIDSAMAGPCEELALLALPVIALRRLGYSWTVVCIVASCLRVPFHMYYGWGSILFALWAIGAVFLYRRTCAIGAIVFSHALHNFVIGLDPLVPGIWQTNIIVCVLAVPVLLGYLHRQRKRLRQAYARH